MPGTDNRPLIYLIGTAGNPHYGDEVITASWLRYYADRLPDAEIWLDTPRPGQTSVLHGDAHPHLRCVDTLFHACWNAPSEVPDECVAFGATVLDEPGRLRPRGVGLSAALRADVVHVLGGAYINAIWPRHLALLGAAARIAERSGARTALTGADLMPVTTDGQAAVGGVLSSFDLVDVRDAESRDMLAETVPNAHPDRGRRVPRPAAPADRPTNARPHGRGDPVGPARRPVGEPSPRRPCVCSRSGERTRTRCCCWSRCHPTTSPPSSSSSPTCRTSRSSRSSCSGGRGCRWPPTSDGSPRASTPT